MREPDPLYDELTGELLRLCLPGEVRRLGTMLSAEEVPEMQPTTPTTSTAVLCPGGTWIALSGETDVSYAGGLMPVVWTKDGYRPHIDKDGILRIHVLNPTDCVQD